MKQISEKFAGSLLGTAIGDALGARFEGSSGVQIVQELGPRYTDDTVMTIGVAESLIEHRGFDYWGMADRFIKNYEREPWRRYGPGPSHIFRMMKSGRMGFGMLDRDIFPGGSWGNGGAMRIGPVGLLYHDDPLLLREIAYHATGITHSNELALEGAALQACAVALAIHADPRNATRKEFLGALNMFCRLRPYQDQLKLVASLLDREPEKEEVAELLGVGVEALHSVPTAIYSFLANPGFESAVMYAVSLGGDTDTIGAMTGAIAGAWYGVESIPPHWKEKIENRIYLEALAKGLYETWVHLNEAKRKTDNRDIDETDYDRISRRARITR